MSKIINCASTIYEAVGGSKNISNIGHCLTRLRLTLKDRSLVDEEKLNELKEVKGLNDSGDQFQIILGTGTVNKVYKEFIKIFEDDGGETSKAKGGNHFQRISQFFGSIFIPILPVIIASGILLGVKSFLLTAGIVENSSASFKILSVLIDTGFAFLPVLVAWSTAKQLKGSEVIAIVIGLMLISSALPSAPAIARGNAVPLELHFAGLTFMIKGFQGSILVAIFAGWAVTFFENLYRKIIPSFLDLILTPLLTLATAYFVILLGVGPVLQLLELNILHLFVFFFNLPFGIGGFIIGFLQQILVITGLHHILWTIDINLLKEYGVNANQLIRNASVLGQTGAVLGFTLFSKSKKLRSDSLAASISGFFGITEPAIFGFNLPYRKPFLFGLIGSGIGGMLAKLMNFGAKGMGTAGIPGYLYYIGNPRLMLLYTIQSLVTVLIPLILTAIYIKRLEKNTL